MIIHFFRERTKPRIDFYQLVDGYFDNLENCVIKSNDDELEISINMNNFDFTYKFLITKRSRVSSLYRLNRDYTNLHFLCEVPSVLPQYISRLIFKQISEICEKFELAIYCDLFDNIHQFDMFELITALGKDRLNYLEEHENVETYKMPMPVLNEMCCYQSMINELPSLVKGDCIVKKYNILKEKRTGVICTSISWKVGTPTLFPPHLNYVQVEEEENLVALVPVEIFYKYVEKLMNEVKDVDFKLLYLNEKTALKAKKLIKKMRKAVVSYINFEEIKITNLIES